MASHNIKVNLASIAKLLNGQLRGDDIEITGLCTPEEQVSGCMCIIAQKKLTELTKNGSAAAYIVAEGLVLETDKPQIIIKDVKDALVKILNFIYPSEEIKHHISNHAAVGENVNISNPCYIDNFVSISSNSSIGKNTKIYPLVVIGENVLLLVIM